MRAIFFIFGFVGILMGVFYFMTSAGSSSTARIHLIETWSTIEDSQFTREFRSDGKVIDTKGSVSVTRNWALFTKRMPIDGIPFSLEEGAQYLSLAVINGDSTYFKIDQIDSKNLKLTDLNTQRSVSFKPAP